MKTPGVYIQELDAFGNAIAPVATAIPVFIGHTMNTSYNGSDLLNKAIKVTSLAEFFLMYGDIAPPMAFNIKETTPEPDLVPASTIFRLYAGMKFFYANGGGDCYVMTVGDYSQSLDKSKFFRGIDLLKKESSPTLLVIPDAVSFEDESAYEIQNHMINHCGELEDRVAILDVPSGFREIENRPTSVDNFRDKVGGFNAKSNSYAIAYYPWLHTTVFEISEIGYKNIDKGSYDKVVNMLHADVSLKDTLGRISSEILKAISQFTDEPDISTPAMTLEQADSILKNVSKTYKQLMTAILTSMNLIPPSAAMAGIYTAVDHSTGVWKAPANVVIQNVIAPSVHIDSATQEDLNIPINGKSICAIRSFPGMGCLVWGARTLDGNSNDWRYINVRRTLIYLEQSIKDAGKAYVFAPNDAATWVNVRQMITNFLTGVWKQGGLVGPKPADAFSVNVGLGSTMTNTDIVNGRMIVSVKVAISHPAEFIEITFQQQMQSA